MNTIPLSAVPAMLGAWDRIHAAAEDADEIAAERQAKREHLSEQLKAAIQHGDAWATCHFANRRSMRCKDGGYVTAQENLGSVLADALDGPDDALSFHDVAAYLMARAKAGDGAACSLLDRMTAVWVEQQL
jgi:hypothetical protein